MNTDPFSGNIFDTYTRLETLNDTCLMHYQAGLTHGITAGSIITLFIWMCFWQCTRPRFTRKEKIEILSQFIK